MERRDALVGLVGWMAWAGCGSPAAEPVGPDPARSGAPPPEKTPAADPPADDAVAALRAVVYDCIEAGETCDAHCQRLLRDGDTSIAECSTAVADMLAVMGALSELLASKSPHHAALTKVAVEVCRTCEAACKKHAGHHAECKACMEACAATIAAGEKLG